MCYTQLEFWVQRLWSDRSDDTGQKYRAILKSMRRSLKKSTVEHKEGFLSTSRQWLYSNDPFLNFHFYCWTMDHSCFCQDECFHIEFFWDGVFRRHWRRLCCIALLSWIFATKFDMKISITMRVCHYLILVSKSNILRKLCMISPV